MKAAQPDTAAPSAEQLAREDEIMKEWRANKDTTDGAAPGTEDAEDRNVLDATDNPQARCAACAARPDKAIPAQRTVYNIYSVVSALFRDAELAGAIERSPCVLGEQQLGPLVDADPKWRGGSLFTRDEAETLISHAEIPPDRQLVYAFGLLAGMRPGEASVLRWRHYDPTTQPLGKLTVALAYNTRKHRAKSTKTDAVRSVPVHPALAAMLATWKLSRWFNMMGRQP
jgi:integrase